MVQNGLKVNLPLDGGGLMKECKGCLALAADEVCTNGLDQDMPKDDLCPCFNCIVKVVCQDECKEFLDYVKVYRPSLISIKES